MADLDLIVNTKSVVDALGQVRKLEGQIKALTDRFVRGSVDQQTYAKGLLEIKREYTQIGVSSQKASGQVDKLAKSFKNNSNEVERLRNKYNPLYAISKQYETAIEEINKANRIGALTDAQREAALESLHMEYAAGTGRFAAYNQAMQASQKGMARSGVIMQQTGYQVGDFLVQVQSGTNAFVAFGQQATQLAGLLTMSMNPKLIALGAGLSIIIPLLTAGAAAFMRTREDADDANDSVAKLEETLKSLSETAAESAKGLELISRGLEDVKLFDFSESIGALETEIERLEGLIERTQESGTAGSGYARLGLRILGGINEEEQERLDLLREQLEVYKEHQRQLEQIERTRFVMQEESDLQNQIQLLQVQLQYGEDSIELEKTRLEQARQAFLLEAMRNGVYGDQLTNLMAMYDEYVKLNALANQDFIGPIDPRGRGGRTSSPRGQTRRSIEEIIAARQKQLDQEQILLELSRDRAAARRIEFELENQYQGTITEAMREQIETAAESMAAQEERIRQLEELRDRNQAVADSIADNFGKALTSVVDGTKSVKDAFKDMARAIIADLYQMYVVKQITGFISNSIGSFLGGGAGVVDTQYTGGSMRANQPYLVGENGPELVIPRKSSTVVNSDLTGKALGGGESVNVTQVFNINGNGDEYIMGKIAQAAPKIADVTKQSILNERRRGGVYKSVFG